MKKKLLSLSISLLSGVLIIAQSRVNPVGVWKNVSNNEKTSFIYRFDANGNGSISKDSRTGINDKCDCLSTMKYPFTWFIKKDSVFLSFMADSSTSNASTVTKPGMVASNKELEMAKSICNSSVAYVFMEEKSRYKKSPNQKSKIEMTGNTLTITGLPYIKQ